MPKTTEQYSDNDPRRHTAHLKEKLNEIIRHAREDVTKISEPKAQALFETTAEVSGGLSRALEDYDRKNESAWR